MKLVEGVFKYGETVVIEIDGSLYKRKVHFSDDTLYVSIGGKKYEKDSFHGSNSFDQSAYVMKYLNENRDRISVLAAKGTKDIWKAAARDHGMSMNAFIIHCVEKEINGK